MKSLLTFASFVLVAGLIVVGCEQPVSPTDDGFTGTAGNVVLAKATVTQYDYSSDVDSDILHPCTGETVHVTGHIRDKYQVVEDGNGGYHVSENANYQGVSGVNMTSGTRYNLNGAAHINETLKKGESLVYTAAIHWIASGNAPDDDFVQYINQKVTINANGELVVDRLDSYTECK